MGQQDGYQHLSLFDIVVFSLHINPSLSLQLPKAVANRGGFRANRIWVMKSANFESRVSYPTFKKALC